MEFFLAHNVVELNSYFECLTDNGHAWTWGQRFKSLEHTLTGDALVNWKELMVEDYPDPAETELREGNKRSDNQALGCYISG